MLAVQGAVQSKKMQKSVDGCNLIFDFLDRRFDGGWGRPVAGNVRVGDVADDDRLAAFAFDSRRHQCRQSVMVGRDKHATVYKPAGPRGGRFGRDGPDHQAFDRALGRIHRGCGFSDNGHRR